MADTRPTPISFRRALWLCLLGVLAWDRLMTEQERDNAARNQFSDQIQHDPPARILHRAIWGSLGLVASSSGTGYLLGWCVANTFGCIGPPVIVGVQGGGATFLLWATLFVRGWEIQTGSGVTLVERVNRWLYRGMYCVGTSVQPWSSARWH